MFDTWVFLSHLFFWDPLATSGRLLTEILKAGQVEKRADQKKAFSEN